MSELVLQTDDPLELVERVFASLWAIAQLCPDTPDDALPNNLRLLCLLLAERLDAAYYALNQERERCTCGQRTRKEEPDA
jgi:hypothetical protein